MTTKAKAKSEAIEAAVETGAAATEAAAQAGNETVKTAERAMDEAKQQAKQASAMAAKGIDEATRAGRSTYESWLQTSETLAKGFEQVNKTMMSFAQYSLDANMNAARQLMSCASVNEAVSIQSRYLKSTFDSMLAEGNKVSEITTSTFNEAFGPLTSQIKTEAEKLWKPLAA